MDDDKTLLKEFVRNESQAAFETLVSRYTSLVYNSAQRRVGADHAQDITQAVFIILANKAESLSKRNVLNIAGWLFTTTRYASLQAMRSEKRRRIREDNATTEQTIMSASTDEPLWEDISPNLDAAIDTLSSKDRQAIVLRFFKQASHADIGQALGVRENTATQRVNRALRKLTTYFSRRGQFVTGATLTALVMSKGTCSAAVGISTASAVVALSGGSVGTIGSVSSLVSQTTHALLLAQIKWIATTAITCSIVIGSAAVGVAHSTADAKQGPDIQLLGIAPFALTYKGRTELPDGHFEFQLNDRNTRISHFVALGDQLMGYSLTEHTLKSKSIAVDGVGAPLVVDVSELTLTSPSHTVSLIKDKRTHTEEWVATITVANAPPTLTVGVGSFILCDDKPYEVMRIEHASSTITLRDCDTDTPFMKGITE